MADTVEKMRPHGRGERRGASGGEDRKIHYGESDGGNIGKYQRVKGGKTAEKSRGYSVLWKVKKC